MLKIRDVEFSEKFTEMNIRQRMYQGKSYITLMITTEFYPSLMNDQIVSGMIEVKVDMEDIHCVDDLIGKNLKGDIGSATLSVNNDGIWEHQTQDQFQIEIRGRKGRIIDFMFVMNEVMLETTGTLVSLYTTSSSDLELKENFDFSDFYDSVVEKGIGDKKIYKYFVKK